MSADPVWSERIRLDRIGQGLTRHLEADAEARARVAKALDLADLSRLEADIEVRPAGAGWRLSGKVTADLVQTCGITLEPLPSQANAEFSVDLVEASEFEPQEDDVEFDVELSDGPDTIEDGGIDLAAYVVEHLALSIDPWPRKPGAVFEAPEGPPEPSPFDVLKDLKPRE